MPSKRKKSTSPGWRDPPAPPLTSERERPEVEVLLSVSRMVSGSLDLDTVLRSAMDSVAEAMNAEACSILLQSDEAGKGELYFHILKGEHTGGLDIARLPIDDNSIAGWVAGHGEALVIPDAYEDSRFNPSYDAVSGFRTRSVLCVPLCAKGAQLGVIQILNRRDGRPFDRRDLELLEAVACLVAIAINNADEHQARLKAERLATLGQAIAGMAHCVKNILNGLQGGSYILERNLQGRGEPALMQGWEMVKRNMQLLSHIVLDMLSYSKKRKPLYKPCDINNVCREVAELMCPQAEKKSVRVIYSPNEGVGVVNLDETAIKRCLINLVGNAADACGKDGEVRLELDRAPDGDAFVIRVRDNGSGIPPEARDKMFDVFYSTKGGKGTGLGLPVTKKIIEEHNGTIQVESTPGAGTDFTIVLPTGGGHS